MSLINSNDIGKLARPISSHIDAARVEAYIIEAEQSKIKSIIGDALLLDLQNSTNTTESKKLLLEGGNYDTNDGKKTLRGLRVAIAYYAYAKLILNNPVNVTRFGTRTLENNQSQGIEWKQLHALAIDAESYADSVMAEVLELLNAKTQDYPLFKTGKKVKPSRTTIVVIGQ